MTPKIAVGEEHLVVSNTRLTEGGIRVRRESQHESTRA